MQEVSVAKKTASQKTSTGALKDLPLSEYTKTLVAEMIDSLKTHTRKKRSPASIKSKKN